MLVAFAIFLGLAANAIAASPGTLYVPSQATGVARAYCPPGRPVIGGGGFVETPPPPPAVPQEEKLRQIHPISDTTGVIAYGNVAIGYQAASSDFADVVVSFAVCGSPKLAGTIQYRSAQATGFARAACLTGEKVIGGGGLVEHSPGYAEVMLRYSHPVGSGGEIPLNDTVVVTSWDTASSDFEDDVTSFVVCTTASITVKYVNQQATGLARASCPAGTTLSGGGGFVEGPTALDFVKLRQSYPISDTTGTIAFGARAIGWQAASSNFADNVGATAICISN